MRLDTRNEEDRKLMARVKVKGGGTLLDEQLALESGIPPPPEPSEDGESKASKYRNTRILREGVWWDSVWEWECWVALKSMQRAGEIRSLRRQVRYDFVVEGVKVGWWTADFVFEIGKVEIVADAKHRATAAKQTWPRTKRLVLALFKREVLVLYKGETDVRAAALQFAAERAIM